DGQGRPPRESRPGPFWTGQECRRRDYPRLHKSRRPGQGTRARPGTGSRGDHDGGRGQRPERPGYRARRQVRRRVRGRGRPRWRSPRAGGGEAGPVRHRRRTSRGRGRSWRRRSRGGAVVVKGEPVLELDGVTKVYGEEPPVPALGGVSGSVRRGGLVAIVGRSGSGKSTLLHIVGTLERPTSGVVRIGDVDAAQLDDRDLSRLRACEIGFVF